MKSLDLSPANIYQKLWYLLIFTIPFEVVQIAINGISLRLHQIVFAVLIPVGIWRYRASIGNVFRTSFQNITAPSWYYQHIFLTVFSVIWILSTLGGIINGENITTALIRAGVLLGYIGVFCIVYYGLRNRTQVYTLVAILAVSTATLIVVGMYEAIALPLGWPTYTVFHGRVDSLLPEPNWFGMWLAIMTAITIPVWYASPQIKVRRLLALLVLGMIFMNVLTITRASWLATAALIITFLGQHLIMSTERKKALRFIPNLSFVILIGIALSQTGLAGLNIVDRVESIFTQNLVVYNESDDGEEWLREEVRDVNVDGRIQNYQDALSISSEHLVIGVGQAGFEERVGPGFNTSNIFLSVLVSSGIIGVSLFVTFFYILFKQGVYFFRQHSEFSSITIGIMVAIGITGMFNDSFLMGFVWLSFALAARLPDLIIDDDLDSPSE